MKVESGEFSIQIGFRRMKRERTIVNARITKHNTMSCFHITNVLADKKKIELQLTSDFFKRVSEQAILSFKSPKLKPHMHIPRH